MTSSVSSETERSVHSSSLQGSSPLDDHGVIVCVGSGGVGKTTVAAAIALAAAERGKRTLCLTIDPARRLASALGLSHFPTEEVKISSSWLADHGARLPGELTAMMLDAKGTFDELVRAHCPTEEQAETILNNRVYHHVSTHLSGTRSYMAMEKVLLALSSERFDLIVLDTPPSARALDFFDAPDKMISALDSPATRALARAVGGHRPRFDLLATGVKRALSAFDRIVGNTLLEEMGALLSSMNVLFGGFEKRAREVARRMRGREFGYFLVASPAHPSLLDGASLSRAMSERDLSVNRWVINRVSPQVPRQFSADELEQSDQWRALELSAEGAQAAVVAARDFARDRQEEEQRIFELGPGAEPSAPPSVLLEESPVLLHRPDRLLTLGRQIVGAANQT